MRKSLQTLIANHDGRIKRERLLFGLALLALFLLAASVASSIGLVQRNFSAEAIFWARVALGCGSLQIVGAFVLWPLLRSRSPRQVARFLEERHPELQDRLSTAVEIDAPHSSVDPELCELVAADACHSVKRLAFPRFYWPRLSVGSLTTVGVCLLVFVLLFFGGPEAYRYSLGKLVGQWLDESAAPLYQVQVAPGDAVVGERADLEISARVNGFTADSVRLFARYERSPGWDSTPMQLPRESGDYTFHFFDLRERVEYYVDADGIRSDTFTIRVTEMPRVERLEVTLHFPPYVGLEDVTVRDEKRITALQGTRAALTVETDLPANGGSIRFDSGAEIPLSPSGARVFSGAFEVERDDYFRIFLRNSEGVLNPASAEVTIEALEDHKPSLRFLRPGRDQRVTNLEEVLTEVRADDDFGILNLSLIYSVNGASEVKVSLPATQGARRVAASHLFYLEDFNLTPGDFVSYYAQASDAVSTSVSDIFFFEVEPFDRAFFQSQQSGGGQGQNGLELSRQQKQVVVGTFALIQEREEVSAADFEENVQTLAMVEQRLQTQAQTIIDRLSRRAGAISDPKFERMAKELRQAVTHMQPAAQALSERKLEPALSEEKLALQALLRAEALFTDVQVAMSEAGEMGSAAEDLADLVDLELDRTKNQYETLRQNREAERDEALDAALEKLKELARRQEQDLARRRQAQAGSVGGGSDPQIADEIEKLARQLERLSREERQPPLSRASRELERAAQELRASATSGQGQSSADELARQAMDRMRQTQGSLAQRRREGIEQDFEELEAQAQRLRDTEQTVLEQMARMESGSDPGSTQTPEGYRQARELYRTKQEQQQDLQSLEGKLHTSARRLEGEEPAASRKLKAAGNSIRDQRLPDLMREGNELLAGGLAGLARRREARVAEELEKLQAAIRDARRNLGTPGRESQEDRLRRALDEAGQLGEGLEALRQQAEDRQSTAPAPGRDQGRVPGAARGQGSQGIDPDRARREWRERVQQAEALEHWVQGDPELRRRADELVRQMRAVSPERVYADPQEVDALKAKVLDGLHQLELEISRRLRERNPDVLRQVIEAEVPAEYRERVAEYYRKLSEQRKP